MLEHIHNVVLNTIPRAMVKIQFFSISCDKITSINNQMWANVHVYVVQDWHIFILFFLCVHVYVVQDWHIFILFFLCVHVYVVQDW
jgi:hypothetical protein